MATITQEIKAGDVGEVISTESGRDHWIAVVTNAETLDIMSFRPDVQEKNGHFMVEVKERSTRLCSPANMRVTGHVDLRRGYTAHAVVDQATRQTTVAIRQN